MSLRVSELQVLLGYAGRNKHGRKHELLTKALHLLKAGCSPAVQMKIKELYRRRFPTKMVSPVDLALPGVHSASSLPTGLAQLGFDSHGSPSPLLPVSLLGPKHELSLPHLPSVLHPVHPDVKLQRLPFYDVLDELIKPTSLGECPAMCAVIACPCVGSIVTRSICTLLQPHSIVLVSYLTVWFLFHSFRQHSAVPGSMLCFCINTTASSTDQQLHVSKEALWCMSSAAKQIKKKKN